MGLTVICREDALRDSLTTYFTGLPCKRGHVTLRQTSNKECRECSRLRSKRRYENNKEKAKEENRRWHKINAEKRKIRQRKWKLNNKNKIKQSNLRYLQ